MKIHEWNPKLWSTHAESSSLGTECQWTTFLLTHVPLELTNIDHMKLLQAYLDGVYFSNFILWQICEVQLPTLSEETASAYSLTCGNIFAVVFQNLYVQYMFVQFERHQSSTDKTHWNWSDWIYCSHLFLMRKKIMWRPSDYPLVICYIAIEHGHRNSGFTH